MLPKKSPASGIEMYTRIVKLFLKLYNGTSVIHFGTDYVLPAFLAVKRESLSTLVLIGAVNRLSDPPRRGFSLVSVLSSPPGHGRAVGSATRHLHPVGSRRNSASPHLLSARHPSEQ
jgi:hypothetical protein